MNARSAVVVHPDPGARAAASAALVTVGLTPVEFDATVDALASIQEFVGCLVLISARDITTEPAVLSALRAHGAGAIIAIADESEEEDGLRALETGTDDLVALAASNREFLGRLRAALRRVKPDATRQVTFGTLSINLATRTVGLDGREIELTALEFDLLAFLATTPRIVYSREELLIRVWGARSGWQGPATVTEHIHRLRMKLGEDRAHPRWLRTVHGRGYSFDPSE